MKTLWGPLYTIAIVGLMSPLSAAADPPGQRIRSGIETQVERGVSERVQSEVEERASARAEESVSARVSEEATRAAEASVSEQVGEDVGQAVKGTVEAEVQEGVAAGVRSAAGGQAEAAVDASVENAVRHRLKPEEAGKPSIAGPELSSAPPDPAPAVRDVDKVVSGSDGERANQSSTASGGGAVESTLAELPGNDQWQAVRGEWLVLVERDESALFDHADIRVLERARLDQVGMTLVRFRVAESLDSYRALRRILPERAFEKLDRNHVYEYRPQTRDARSQRDPVQLATICTDPVKVGIVDTAVDEQHSGLAGLPISQRKFVDERGEPAVAHGTAVAGLLLGRGDDLTPLLPRASLSVAAVMHHTPDGEGATTVMNLLSALDWLAGEQVDVINMSIAGPPNQLLERAVERLSGRDMVLVAAVGNEGPAAPPLYPAAYEGVLGATAVDARRRIYRWANRGEQVDFAALGVGVRTLSVTGGTGVESGTSMAAPVVSAHAACVGAGSDVAAKLTARSIDLGDRGRDPVFGLGLLP